MAREGNDSRLIEEIAEELSDIRAAVLVGAGASAEAGLPTWKTLLDSMAQELPAAYGQAVSAFVAEGKFLEAAEMARRAMPDETWWQSRLEPFAKTGIVTSAWRLISAMGIPKMVTTNWDNIGEDSYANVWSRTPSIHVGLDEVLTPLDDPFPHIIHVHGKAPRWSTILLTASEYEKAEKEHRYRELWTDILLRRPLLVVGFSGADPAFARVLRYIREDLRIAHKIKPVVIVPASVPPDSFGGHARILSYDDSSDHRGALAILRDLRDRIDAVRKRAGLNDDPFARAGLPAHFTAQAGELAYAFLGSDLRRYCSAEMLTTVSLLLNELANVGSTSACRVAELASTHMRLSAIEAEEMSEHAVGFAKSHGWVTGNKENLLASEATPRPDSAQFSGIVDEVIRGAQKPLVWTATAQHKHYIKSALLEYLGSEGGRAARSLLGLESGEQADSARLHSALLRSHVSAGDAKIERQICASVMYLTTNPPHEIAESCGRLANFAVVQNLVGLSAGRELLRSISPVEAVYFDTNIILPAMAPGHRWSKRCASLMARCRRVVPRMLVLDGFAEELAMQLRDAEELAESAGGPEELFRLSWTHGQSNGFLDAYRGWCEQSGLRSFDHYKTAIGLSDTLVRLRGLGCTVVPAPRDHGFEAGIHAKVTASFGGSGRPEKLVRHEADQIVQLVRDNHPQGTSVRFVTAHERLRKFLVREHVPIASVVTPPIALAHLLAATAPSDVPPETLRDLAFDTVGVQVAEVIYGVLLTRWQKDNVRLRKLASAEVTEEIMSHLRRLTEQFGSHGAIDSRAALLDVVEKDVLPSIELRAAAVREPSRILLEPLQSSERPSEAAIRLATQLNDLTTVSPKKPETATPVLR